MKYTSKDYDKNNTTGEAPCYKRNYEKIKGESKSKLACNMKSRSNAIQ